MSIKFIIGGTPTPAPETLGSWQLAAGHYVSTAVTGMLPTIVYPRPSGESNADAHYKNAYTGRAWSLQIDVQGGSYPYRFELTSFPAGMTIGSFLVISADKLIDDGTHGLIQWANPTVGNHTVAVRITDQNGNPETVSWTLVVGTAGHVFVDSVNGDDITGDGTLAAPYQTLHTGIFGNNNGAGKVCELLAGSYTIHDGAGNEAIVDPANHPRSYIAASGASVTFDMSTARINPNNCDDFRLQGIDLDGFKALATSWRCVFLSGSASRVSLFNCTFDNMGVGTDGGDNPGCIVSWATVNNYISISRCTTKSGIVRLPLYTGFDVNYLVVANCTGDQTDTSVEGNSGFWIKSKGSHSNVSIRANKILGITESGEGVIEIGDMEAEGSANCEMCYNAVYINDVTSGLTTYAGYAQRGTGPATNFLSYRNSFVSVAGKGLGILNSTNSNVVKVINDVLYGGSGDLFGDVNNYDETDNLKGLTLGDDIDTNCNLSDIGVANARTTYLGTRGHEIA